MGSHKLLKSISFLGLPFFKIILHIWIESFQSDSESGFVNCFTNAFAFSLSVLKIFPFPSLRVGTCLDPLCMFFRKVFQKVWVFEEFNPCVISSQLFLSSHSFCRFLFFVHFFKSFFQTTLSSSPFIFSYFLQK